jgi:hypothetical protein
VRWNHNNHRLARISFFLMMIICWASLCFGQLSGRFYLDREAYAPGEPVFMYFEVTNNSADAYNILAADPYSFCSGYRIHVSSDPMPGSVCKQLDRAGSCLLSQVLLFPGKSRTERILLNYDHEIDRPGDYQVGARRRLPYREGESSFLSSSAPAVEFAGQLRFRIDSDKNIYLYHGLLRSLADQLQSSDPPTVIEAARTLAALGPHSMESTLLQFPENSLSRPYAPLAFHRLNTKRSTVALAQLLRQSRMGSPENLESATYLGDTGDPQWFPLLRDLASKQPGGEYVYPAAQAGGDDAVPFLTGLMHRREKLSVDVAISGFAYTGSRAAIPILLKLLNGPNTDSAGRALYGLRRLTHMTIGRESWPDRPQSQYPRWAQWWERSEKTSRIYKANECGDFHQLP